MIDLGLALDRDGVEKDERGADLAVGLARELLLLDHVKQVLTSPITAGERIWYLAKNRAYPR
jgi:hypothetical protein